MHKVWWWITAFSFEACYLTELKYYISGHTYMILLFDTMIIYLILFKLPNLFTNFIEIMTYGLWYVSGVPNRRGAWGWGFPKIHYPGVRGVLNKGVNTRIAELWQNVTKIAFFWKIKIQFLKKHFWIKNLKKKYFYLFLWNNIEKKVKKGFFKFFFPKIFFLNRKKKTVLKCHTHLGNARALFYYV